jgi:hypothetical protein
MNLKTLGCAVGLAWACLSATQAFGLDLAGGGQTAGTSFATSDNKNIDPVKPWHAYSDPSCESSEVPKLSFSSTAFGSAPRGHGHEQSVATFDAGGQKHGQVEHRKQYFEKNHKYDVSNFQGYGHHGHWKPEPTGDYCTPIPEPQTYALLIMGLGALTVVARRRKLALNTDLLSIA